MVATSSNRCIDYDLRHYIYVFSSFCTSYVILHKQHHNGAFIKNFKNNDKND